MWHSVKSIASNYSELSEKRGDKKRFDYNDFLEFAETNKKKYDIIDEGYGLLVNTWNSNDLIDDYRKTIKKGS